MRGDEGRIKEKKTKAVENWEKNVKSEYESYIIKRIIMDINGKEVKERRKKENGVNNIVFFFMFNMLYFSLCFTACVTVNHYHHIYN